MSFRRMLAVIALAITFITIGSLPALSSNRDREMKVMTYNMYPGAELGEIFTAQSQFEVLLEVGEAYNDMLAGNVPERIAAIADQIEDGEPVLVGLQEVAVWRTGTAFDPADATDVKYDFLRILLDELSARQLHYVPIAIQTNLEAELPGFIGPNELIDIRYTDRLVILARTDLSESEFKLEQTDASNFQTNLQVPVLGQPVTVLRGWTSADVKHRGKTYRFINSHLESYFEQVQLAQASELIQGPANSSLPVILAGDFNSDAAAGGTAYGMFISAGFNDVWNLMPNTATGYTWPLSAEVPNVIMSPTQRLDLILTRGPIIQSAIDVVGEDTGSDMTPSGFRPSDHAGLVASFVVEP